MIQMKNIYAHTNKELKDKQYNHIIFYYLIILSLIFFIYVYLNIFYLRL